MQSHSGKWESPRLAGELRNMYMLNGGLTLQLPAAIDELAVADFTSTRLDPCARLRLPLAHGLALVQFKGWPEPSKSRSANRYSTSPQCPAKLSRMSGAHALQEELTATLARASNFMALK